LAQSRSLVLFGFPECLGAATCSDFRPVPGSIQASPLHQTNNAESHDGYFDIPDETSIFENVAAVSFPLHGNFASSAFVDDLGKLEPQASVSLAVHQSFDETCYENATIAQEPQLHPIDHLYPRSEENFRDSSLDTTGNISPIPTMTSILEPQKEAIYSNTWRHGSESQAIQRDVVSTISETMQCESSPPVFTVPIRPAHRPIAQKYRRYTFASDSTVLHGRRSPKITFVSELGLSDKSPNPQRNTKGRRKGPLPAEIRRKARRSRQNKSVCIRCKLNRQAVCTIHVIPHKVLYSNELKCEGHPCYRCKEMGTSLAWKQPCTKAHFLDIIESGTCNYICKSMQHLNAILAHCMLACIADLSKAQRAVNHITIDGSKRVRVELPELIDIDNLLKRIDNNRNHFNIRVTQGGSSLYILNLDRCFNYIKAIRKELNTANHDLRGFIDHVILKAGDWASCIQECKPNEDLLVSIRVPYKYRS
jgi:hypothetical protein